MGRPLSTAQPASAPSQPLAWHAGGACHEGSSSEGGCRPWDCHDRSSEIPMVLMG